MANIENSPEQPETASDDVVVETLSHPCARSRIFGQIFQHVRDHSQADQLCQQVCMKLLQQKARFDPTRGSVWQWISGFVKNERRAHSSQQRSRREISEQQLDHHISPGTVSPVELLEQSENIAQLLTHIGKLSDRSRAALWHHYINGDSDSEAARLLGITEANLRQIRRRALHELRQMYGVQVGVTS